MVEQSHKTASRFYEADFQGDTHHAPPLVRAVIGAGYGLLLGLMYALIAGVIDALLMRDVPIRVDWPRVLNALFTTGLGLAVLGAVTGWPANLWWGIVLGAVTSVAWLLIQSFIQLQGFATLYLLFVLSLIMLCLPITAILRWAIERHQHNHEQGGPHYWRAQLVLLAVVLGVGAFAGSWSQMPPAAQEAVRTVNRLVQRALTQPAEAQWPRAFDSTPELRQHAGVPYGLTQRASVATPDGVEVIVSFDDGYVITCLVDTIIALTECAPGGESVFGPFQFNPNDQR